MKSLSELIGATLPEAIASLPDSRRRDLTALIGGAKKAQAQELGDAARSLLDLVPGFLRGAVKRAAGL